MEDGAFLGRVISEALRGIISPYEAISLYEKKRIPRAWLKQQVSFVSGLLFTATGSEQKKRDSASAPEVALYDRNPVHPELMPPTYRPWQLFASPATVPGILHYDAESDADFAVCEYLQNKGNVDPETMLSKDLRNKWWDTIHDNGLQRRAGGRVQEKSKI